MHTNADVFGLNNGFSFGSVFIFLFVVLFRYLHKWVDEKKTEIAIVTVFQNLSVYIYHAASPPAMRVLHMTNACFSLSFSFANLF